MIVETAGTKEFSPYSYHDDYKVILNSPLQSNNAHEANGKGILILSKNEI